MTLKFSATIIVDAEEKTSAILDAVNTDSKFYPQSIVKAKLDEDKGQMNIHLEYENIAPLRANLNSLLRLIQASYESIESVKI